MKKVRKLSIARETLHLLEGSGLGTAAGGSLTGNMYSCADGCSNGLGCGQNTTPKTSCGLGACTTVCTVTVCSNCCHQ